MKKEGNSGVSAVEQRNHEVHRLGRVSGLVCILAMLGVPLVIQLVYQVELDMGGLLAAFMAMLAFLIVGVIEVISYGPILGPGATYLAFITGNVSNMKLPAAISGMGIAKAKPGTEKGNTVSTLAVGISSIVTTLVVFIGMLMLSTLLPVLNNPVLKPALDNMIYALMGAFATPMILKDLKGFSVPAIVVAIIIFGGIPIPSYILMPLMLVVAVLWAYVLYKMKQRKLATASSANSEGD